MINQIISMLVQVFSAVSQWHSTVLTRTGTLALVTGSVFLVILLRLIVAPIVGASIQAAGSDYVKASKENMRQKGKYEKHGKYEKRD